MSSTTSQFDPGNMTEEEMMNSIIDMLPTILLGCSMDRFEEVQNDRYRELVHYMRVQIGLNAGLFAWNLVTFLLICLFCTGLIRQIFTLKAISVALSCLLEIAPNATISSGDFNADYSGYFLTGMLDYEIVKNLAQIFESLYQYLTMYFLFELHNLICKMERVEQSIIRLLARAGAGLVVIVSVIAVQCGLEAILGPCFDESQSVQVYEAVRPMELIMNSVFTVLTIFYGVQSIAAMRDSDRFREQCNISRPSHENQFVVRMIITSILCQMAKMILQIIKAVLDGMTRYAWLECQTNAKTFYLTYVKCIKQFGIKGFINTWATKVAWFHLIEQTLVNYFVINKRSKK